MSLESAIEELTAAVKENTAAHAALAEVAKAASAGVKTVTKKVELGTTNEAEHEQDEEAKAAAEAEAKKKEAAKKRREAAAAKKKAEAEAKAAAEAEQEEDDDGDLLGVEDDDGDDAGDALELVTEASMDDVKAVAGSYLDTDDEDYRDENKTNVIAAFKHLGVKKLGGLVDDDEGRAKLVNYINLWKAGQKVDFRQVDEGMAA